MIRRINKNKKIAILYLQENVKEIMCICLIFLIGIIIGVMLVNKINDERKK